jgi:hypothetical protein
LFNGPRVALADALQDVPQPRTENPVKHAKLAVLLLATAAAAAGCQPKAEVVTPAVQAPQKPVASILDLMSGQIDPAADFIWESVASVSTAAGMVEHRPRTDEEWLEVRMRALQLAEAANLLMTPGRRVAHEGQRLDDEDAPGNLTAAQAQAAIDADHGTFVAFAAVLRETAERTIEAIDKRDVDAYLEVGGHIDEACEQCHYKFWYPGATPPPTAMR